MQPLPIGVKAGRMPTAEELHELVENCDWQWTSLRGHYGYKVTGPNGYSIFLPAAGCYIRSSFSNIAQGNGNYWCSTPSEENAYCLYFYNGNRAVYSSSRYYGRSVRPVSDK